MHLTWRDGVATVLVGVAGAVYLAVTRGWDWPMVGSVRSGVLAVGLVGLAACAIGGSMTALNQNAWTVFGTIGGVIALALIVIGLVTADEVWLTALIALTIVLWIVATMHGMVGGKVAAPREVHRPAGA